MGKRIVIPPGKFNVLEVFESSRGFVVGRLGRYGDDKLKGKYLKRLTSGNYAMDLDEIEELANGIILRPEDEIALAGEEGMVNAFVLLWANRMNGKLACVLERIKELREFNLKVK